MGHLIQRGTDGGSLMLTAPELTLSTTFNQRAVGKILEKRALFLQVSGPMALVGVAIHAQEILQTTSTLLRIASKQS